MKQHMATHRSSDVYICNEDKCTFECATTDDLQRHSYVHLNHGNNSRSESYSDVLQHNDQSLNNDGFIGPMKNGKPPKATDKHRNAYNPPPRPPIPSKNNHSPEQHSQQHAHSGPRRGFIRDSNNGSSLAVPTRPHWAKICASRYDPETTQDDVKMELEAKLLSKTGTKYTIQVEQLETKFDTYCSFKISCYCIESEVFMDCMIWPTNVLVKWFVEKRYNRSGFISGQNPGQRQAPRL